MPLIRPFAGLRPAPGRAEDVVAPPYDVLNSAEARERVAGRPWSFLHISKAEIDLPEGTDPYDPAVYACAAANLKRMIEEGVLKQDEQACYYVYRLTMGDHQQTGLVAASSVADYDSNRIRKHEFTRPAKEDDRVRQIDALDCQTGPVLLAYRSQSEIDAMLMQAAEAEPDIDLIADDGIGHTLWVVRDAGLIDAISAGFDAMDCLYIADGHHRSAAASRIAAQRKSECEQSSDYFLSVIFPHRQMKIFDYNRVVSDLNGLTEEQFLERVGDSFTVTSSDTPVRPDKTGSYGLYLGGKWYLLVVNPDRVPSDDPVARLDVSVLADQVLAPILDITDPRTDVRIDFVGGIRGLEGLEKRVDSGEMVAAFSLYPTSMEDLMSVADADEVMPPKSTWFEPKLADGLVSHMLD